MFSFLFRKHPTPVLSSAKTLLSPPLNQHFQEWAALRNASRDFLQPWEPVWTEDELTHRAFRTRCRRAFEDAANGAGHVFLIFERERNVLVGGVTLGHLRGGVSLSAQIGYWMGETHAGHGHMTDAVEQVVAYAFDVLGLHRLEAACIPGNERSIKVLLKSGFSQEGLLKSYLKINGQWEDHLLFARISGETGTG